MGATPTTSRNRGAVTADFARSLRLRQEECEGDRCRAHASWTTGIDVAGRSDVVVFTHMTISRRYQPADQLRDVIVYLNASAC